MISIGAGNKKYVFGKFALDTNDDSPDPDVNRSRQNKILVENRIYLSNNSNKKMDEHTKQSDTDSK